MSVATSPEPGSGHLQRRSQGELYNGGSRQGAPQTNRRLSEEDVLPEEEADDSETAPAMSPRLQRQQSSMLLLEKVTSGGPSALSFT